MSFKCPNCQTQIFSRAHRVCQTCGVALPPELLLPEAQIRYAEEKAKRDLKAELEADKNLSAGGRGDTGGGEYGA
jgi:transcription initiation factor TFIIIB Brf1 subunit/transcription initiation factor TFIIB